jgi:hypothetical protein
MKIVRTKGKLDDHPARSSLPMPIELRMAFS